MSSLKSLILAGCLLAALGGEARAGVGSGGKLFVLPFVERQDLEDLSPSKEDIIARGRPVGHGERPLCEAQAEFRRAFLDWYAPGRVYSSEDYREILGIEGLWDAPNLQRTRESAGVVTSLMDCSDDDQDRAGYLRLLDASLSYSEGMHLAFGARRTLISKMSALSMERQSMRQIARHLSRVSHDVAGYAALRLRLERHAKETPPFARTFQDEQDFFGAVIDQFLTRTAQGEDPDVDDLPYPAWTIRLFRERIAAHCQSMAAEIYGTAIVILEGPEPLEGIKAHADWVGESFREKPGFFATIFSPAKTIARALVAISVPNFRGAYGRFLGALADRRGALLLLDLYRYRSERGSFPGSLEELETWARRDLPRDPFGGEPFLYHVEGAGFRLYSRWFDGLDDGGDPKRDLRIWPKHGDR